MQCAIVFIPLRRSDIVQETNDQLITDYNKSIVILQKKIKLHNLNSVTFMSITGQSM